MESAHAASARAAANTEGRRDAYDAIDGGCDDSETGRAVQFARLASVRFFVQASDLLQRCEGNVQAGESANRKCGAERDFGGQWLSNRSAESRRASGAAGNHSAGGTKEC